MGHINRLDEIDQLKRRISELKSDLDNILKDDDVPAPDRSMNGLSEVLNISGRGLVDTARRLIQEFELRHSFFDKNLFSDPAWLILLDLFVHNTVGRPVSVSSLYLAAKTPPTTALRWINALVDRGMIERLDDPTDRRRVHLKLSPAAYENMTAYLAGIAGVESGAVGRPVPARMATAIRSLN